MRSKYLLLLFIPLCWLAACKSGGNNNFTIIGVIAGAPQQTVTLEEMSANDVITVIDSAHVNGSGNFELSGEATEPGLYRIHFKQQKYILLSIDKGNVKVTGDWNTLENYQVSGSAASVSLRHFLLAIREHLRDFNTMSIVMDTLQAKGNDSVLTTAKRDFTDMRLKFTRFIEDYADTTSYLPNAVFAARILNPATEKPFLQSFTQSLDKRFPNTRMEKDFEDYYAKVSVAAQPKNAPQRVQPAGNSGAASADIGGMAPEVNLPTPDGKMVSLSSQRGKYVLLDFWASWCGPCRAENPNVVAAYSKYKNKNFIVYSVSLDNNRDAWMKAAKDDGMNWIHVSDLKGWESVAARTYNIESIPSNFLIDPTGKIIARDLRGDMLEQQLKGILK
jgi:thiol-disulfide isomerase/thioredoxin